MQCMEGDNSVKRIWEMRSQKKRKIVWPRMNDSEIDYDVRSLKG